MDVADSLRTDVKGSSILTSFLVRVKNQNMRKNLTALSMKGKRIFTVKSVLTEILCASTEKE